MIYKFITNKPELAKYAVSCGVKHIFVDMEYIGKDERQGHLDTHRARHTLDDVRKIKAAITKTENGSDSKAKADLLVRINPIYDGSPAEVDAVIGAGADIIMLPMFTNSEEVGFFIDLVDGRARISLLLETPQALVRLDEILEHHADIHEIHFGLNDMHLGLGLDFMFEVLTGGLVEFAAERIRMVSSEIRFGFGGVARIGEGSVPAEMVLGEHVRLGSEMVILSRTFHQNAETVKELEQMINLKEELVKLDECIAGHRAGEGRLLLGNKVELVEAVRGVLGGWREGKKERQWDFSYQIGESG